MAIEKDFSTLPLSQVLLDVVKELGYKLPTPIQLESIPVLMDGKDLIAQSKTGSGKTAAFVLPILERIDLTDRTPQALILCPTRELSSQVAREVRRLGCRHPGLQVTTLVGGQPIREQKTALKTGSHVIVGTPGRVLDHLNRETFELTSLDTVILDEADRMLEMGFEDEMKKILQKLPKDRQTALFSATFPPTIAALSRAYQNSPEQIILSGGNQSAALIEQEYYMIENPEKIDSLVRVLRLNQPESALIFCNLKATVELVSKELAAVDVETVELHGDMEQHDRDRAMARFRNRSVRILVATDVAARGLDVADLDLVLNFDIPQSPDTYIHRIGRTGRAEKEGLAITFMTSREDFRLKAIEGFTGKKITKKELSHIKERDKRAKVLNKDAAMDTLYISGGRKDKMRPGDILGALTGEAKLNATDIGKIEIHDRFSYVAVSRGFAQVAMNKLRDGKIKGHKFQIKLVR